MTRTDTLVVGTLVALLALIAAVISVPAIQLASSPVRPTPSVASLPEVVARPYVEGVVGHPESVSPLTARTQADRDLVALVFSGLMRLGPGGTLVPDLAEDWTVDKTGRTWTVDLRADARWQDGEPVTADDVVFTIETLQDPAYTGPGASSWNEVQAAASGPSRVTFTLKTPLGGFLQALTQPIVPAHLLGDVPVAALPSNAFGREPVGSGPFAVSDLSDASVTLVPAEALPVDQGAGPGQGASATPGNLATPGPTRRPSRPLPYLPGIEFRYYTDPQALAADFRAGKLDGASGLAPAVAGELSGEPGARSMRYPGSTLTAAVLNLRPGHPEFATPAVRTALLAALDRGRMVSGPFAAAATVANDPIPPSSALFDAKADPPVAFSRSAATKALRAAGWTRSADGWHLPKAKKPLTIEVLSPTEASNPSLFAVAAAVVHDWAAIGLTVVHTPLPPGAFVGDRLSVGKFQVAIADLRIGLDPDLYPLLASSQTLSGGSNISGVQDPILDGLLEQARAPGTMAARTAAYSALQKRLAAGRYVLPLAFADELVVFRDTVSGPSIHQVTDASDRFWDVLTWRLAVGR